MATRGWAREAKQRLGAAEPSRYVVYVAFLLIFAFFAVTLEHDGFLSQTNLLNIVRQTTPVTVMAVAVVFVLSAGEIDLSLGSVVALSALVTADVMQSHSAVLVLSAGSAAVAGILYTGRLQGASYTLGEQDLLTVIAAVVIGGTRLFGGEGSVIGALVGSLIMGMLANGMILWGFSSSEQMIAQGVLLLIAILLTLREPRAEQAA